MGVQAERADCSVHAGGSTVHSKAAGILYIASVAQHKYLQPTLDEFCSRSAKWVDAADTLRQFCQLCAIQLLLWEGKLLF